MGASSSDLGDLVRAKIENLRPKLLDLGRRNPLISTKLTPRSASLVRVVDELPEVLRFNLTNQVPMRFLALPPLENDPLDEQTTTFQDALSSARLSDDVYLTEMEAVDPNGDDSADQVLLIERDLKDRVREALGMPPCQKKAELSLQQHALINGISPSWELPDPDDEDEDGRHEDTDIQTLMLPDDLERRLNGLIEKCRSWQQETGINVLHAAIGFLEWKDPKSTESSFAPLTLLPLKLEKKKTRDGAEFWVRADGDETETNFVLAEKFRREFSVDLPRYEGGSIEEHLKQVADAAPSTMTWKVRRQVAIGIFPSARMAMYLDLDTTRRDFAGNEVVAGLFGGSGGAGATPFADEHDVDDPAIEAKAPYLVLDADSSQFSTIIDIADGKNLAVEGPPGTGKSQTIVNTIANALAQGKKVLFVAEKMAALEVVKSRLEAVGLGEFLLPLQAERSSREQVVQSVRARLELGSTSAPRDYQNRLEKFRQTRAELAGYIQVISQQFGNTGLKIYDVLGKCIATREPLKEAPKKLQAPSVPNIETMNAVQIETALERARSLAAAWFATGEVGEYWNGIECIPLDPFTALELKRLAQETSGAYERADEARLRMAEFGIDAQLDTESLGRLADQLHELLPLAEAADIAFVSSLLSSGRPAELTAFLADCSRLQREDEELAALVETRHDIETATLLREAAATCAQHGIKTLDEAAWVEDLACRKEAQLSLERAQESLKAFIDYFPVAASIPVHVLAKAGQDR